MENKVKPAQSCWGRQQSNGKLSVLSLWISRQPYGRLLSSAQGFYSVITMKQTHSDD